MKVPTWLAMVGIALGLWAANHSGWRGGAPGAASSTTRAPEEQAVALAGDASNFEAQIVQANKAFAHAHIPGVISATVHHGSAGPVLVVVGTPEFLSRWLEANRDKRHYPVQKLADAGKLLAGTDTYIMIEDESEDIVWQGFGF